MAFRGFRLLSRIRTGDWQSKLLLLAQLAVAVVSVFGVLSVLTLQPAWLLGFAVVQFLSIWAIQRSWKRLPSGLIDSGEWRWNSHLTAFSGIPVAAHGVE